jgi:hypothetical protein
VLLAVVESSVVCGSGFNIIRLLDEAPTGPVTAAPFTLVLQANIFWQSSGWCCTCTELALSLSSTGSISVVHGEPDERQAVELHVLGVVCLSVRWCVRLLHPATPLRVCALRTQQCRHGVSLVSWLQGKGSQRLDVAPWASLISAVAGADGLVIVGSAVR